MLIDEHLRRMAEEFPDSTAYTVVDVGALTFSEWDNEANADAYTTNTYPEVLRTLGKMIDGTPKVQTFDTVVSTSHVLQAV